MDDGCSRGTSAGVLPFPLTAEACLALWGPPQIHTHEATKVNFAYAERFLSQPWQAASWLVGSELILRNKPPTAYQSPLTCWGWQRSRNPGIVATCHVRYWAAQGAYLPASEHQQITINHFLNKFKYTELGIGSKIKCSIYLGFTRFVFCCLRWLSITLPLVFQSFTDCTPFLAFSC